MWPSGDHHASFASTPGSFTAASAPWSHGDYGADSDQAAGAGLGIPSARWDGMQSAAAGSDSQASASVRDVSPQSSSGGRGTRRWQQKQAETQSLQSELQQRHRTASQGSYQIGQLLSGADNVEATLRQEMADLQANVAASMQKAAAEQAAQESRVRELQDEVHTLRASEQLHLAQQGDELEMMRLVQRRAQADLAREVEVGSHEFYSRLRQQDNEIQRLQDQCDQANTELEQLVPSSQEWEAEAGQLRSELCQEADVATRNQHMARREAAQLVEERQLLKRHEGCLEAEVDMLRVENEILGEESKGQLNWEAEASNAEKNAQSSNAEALEVRRHLEDSHHLHLEDLQAAEHRILELQQAWSRETECLENRVAQQLAIAENDSQAAAADLVVVKESELWLSQEAADLRTQLENAKQQHDVKLQVTRREGERQEQNLLQQVHNMEEAEYKAGQLLRDQLAEDMEIMGELRQRADELSARYEEWQRMATSLRGACEVELRSLPQVMREEIACALPLEEARCLARLKTQNKREASESNAESSSRSAGEVVDQDSTCTQQGCEIMLGTSAWCSAAFQLLARHIGKLDEQSKELQKSRSRQQEIYNIEAESLRMQLSEVRSEHQELCSSSSPRPQSQEIERHQELRHLRREKAKQRENSRLEEKIQLLRSSLRVAAHSSDADSWPDGFEGLGSEVSATTSSEHLTAPIRRTLPRTTKSNARLRKAASRLEQLASDGWLRGKLRGDLQVLSDKMDGMKAVDKQQFVEREELHRHLQAELQAEVQWRLNFEGSLADLEAGASASKTGPGYDGTEHRLSGSAASTASGAGAQAQIAGSEFQEAAMQAEASVTVTESSTMTPIIDGRILDAADSDIKDLWAELQEKQRELRGLELASSKELPADGDGAVSGAAVHVGDGNASPSSLPTAYPPSPPTPTSSPTARTAEDVQGASASVQEELRAARSPRSARSSRSPRSEERKRGVESAAQVFGRAEALCEARRFKEAVPLFRRVLASFALQQRTSATHGVEAEVWAHLGVAMQSLDDVHAAIESYRNAVQLDPSLHVCFANLATLYNYLADSEHAQENIRKALLLDPGNEDYVEIRRKLLASPKAPVR